MRNSLIISIALLFLVAGCKKPKSGDKPVLKLDDVNTHIPRNGLVRFSFSFISDNKADSIYLDKIVPRCADSELQVTLKVPAYPKAINDGHIDITLANGQVQGYSDMGSPVCGENDTATFKFVLKDVKGNVSDTITSPQIIIFQ